jgi:radical SAM superfamily enzyme YgiQ (UPF0313 family)
VIGKTAALVYPEFDSENDTFWSFRSSLKDLPRNEFGGLKRILPPLGLMGLGNHLLINKYFEKVVIIDRNIDKLDLAKHLDDQGIDMVFMGGMLAQKKGFVKDAKIVKGLGKVLIVGGTIADEGFMTEIDADYGVVNEAEMVIDPLLAGVAIGSEKKIYFGSHTPPEKFFEPDYTLINPNNYVSMPMQTNRGCVWDCEFCDITSRFGKKIRTAPRSHIENALFGINRIRFTGTIFIVDDNHIADPKKAMEIQKIIYQTEKTIGHKLGKYTQVSMELSDDTESTRELRKALHMNAFYRIFIGVETSNKEALKETGKLQNMRGKRTLEDKLKLLSTEVGTVMAGAMYGFDTDKRETLEEFARIINRTSSPIWMAALQMPLAGTKLEKRLRTEGRLKLEGDGNNSDGAMRYITMNMSPRQAEKDMLWFLKTIYSPNAYFRRVMRDVAITHPVRFRSEQSFRESMGSIWSILSGEHWQEYWKHLPAAICNITANMILKLNFNPEFLLRQYLMHCSEYTHFRKLIQDIEQQIAQRQYESWQLRSWKETGASGRN